MPLNLWQQCVEQLEQELPSQQFNSWIRPLSPSESDAGLLLSAPNRFVMDWVQQKYLNRIQSLINGYAGEAISVEVATQSRTPRKPVRAAIEMDAVPFGSDDSELKANEGNEVTARRINLSEKPTRNLADHDSNGTEAPALAVYGSVVADSGDNGKGKNIADPQHQTYLSPNYTFETFVEGKSNQLALAAAQQVAENAGGAYNPLFIYGGVGLGKTHLMQAVGHNILKKNPNARVMYLPSETFVQDMVKALQRNAIAEFKRFYRSLDALLIDDIQFFAGKDRSQEEFFHTFNALLEGDQQVILTCDRFPKEIDGVEDRLKSRFSWGLTVAVEPPELETRVAILMKKAEESGMDIPQDAAFFIAQLVRSNVRELEGALKRVVANAHFTGSRITTQFVKESLRDLLDLQKKQVSIENIQRTVAEYYKIKVSDLYSKRRSRSVARPRQLAMALAKELTNHSLPEIGDSFGGRDHTTVLHACKKIKELRDSSLDIGEDYDSLLRTLTT